MRMPGFSLELAACLTLAACGAPDPDPSSDFIAVEDLRIGSVDDPETSLTAVSTVLPGPDGSIYVGQPQDLTIRVFDRTGTPLRSIGRSGGGPGEFGAVGSIGWLGDTLWVSDFRNRRVSFFGPDGEHRGELSFQTAPAPDNEMLSQSVPSTLMADGTAILAYAVSAEFIRQGDIAAVPVVLIERTGVVLDTVHMRPLTDDQLTIEYGTGRNQGTLYSRQPWPRSPFLAVAPDGRHLYIIDRMPEEGGAPKYGVARVEATGDTLWTERFAYVPLEIDEARRDSALAATTEGLETFRERSGMSALELRDLLADAMTFPAHVPPVTRALVAHEGTLWLLLAHPDGPTWQRIAPDGSDAGRMKLPDGVSLLAVRADTLWGTVRDELDVPYVVRMTIVPGEF